LHIRAQVRRERAEKGTIVSEIEKLLAVQERDVQIVRIENELEDIPARQEAEKTRLAEHQANVASAEEEMQKRQAEVKQLELDVTARKEKINKLRTQQLELKTNREFKAVDQEIATLEEQIAAIEDQELTLMERVEEARSFVSERGAELKEEEELVSEDIEALNDRAAGLREELADLKAARDAAATDVEETRLARYEQLFGRKRSEVVVSCDGGVCGGCHMKLPPYKLHDARKQQNLVTCDFCGRLLYG
jgi:predicted  nucleic acid-binding Zn-ribbon protein